MDHSTLASWTNPTMSTQNSLIDSSRKTSQRIQSIEKSLAASIRIENLTLSYADKVVFRDINGLIKPGSITALVGPSGCGKTSFIMSMNRLTDLIPHCFISGRIFIDEKNIFDKQIDVLKLRRQVGMIFQKPNPFPLSIRKNVEFPLRENGVKSKEKLAFTIERVLKDVGLWEEVRERLDSSALLLSGGQQQRLCMARALALEPHILLMDEPCSALDPISSGIVEDLIISLKGRYTIFIVTHNLSQARRIADEVMFFWIQHGAGRLIEHGLTQQIFHSPREELTLAYINGARG